MGLIRACLKMLPRLRAEEGLQGADIAALGAGAMKPDRARAVYQRLTQAVHGATGPARKRATPTDLQVMGIAVEMRAARPGVARAGVQTSAHPSTGAAQ